MFRKIFLILIFCLSFMTIAGAVSTDPDESKKNNTAGSSQPADSIHAKINRKISFFEAQQKENNNRISGLENELEERKKLNERLTAAILVSKEILQELTLEDKKEN